MWQAIKSSWTLLIGMLLLMISNGLLVTLLTLRAESLGFSSSAIGLMQSAYPLGSLLGCLIAPRFILQVGHIRVFAALASLASAAALIHLVSNDLYTWSSMRLLSGFCFSGLYVVAESWLNSSADNQTRGSLLSVYFIVQTGGTTLGQLLLTTASAQSIILFIVVSILISLSLVPILVSNSATNPYYELPERISFIDLFFLSPMGLVGAFLNGISQGAFFVALGIYGSLIGLNGSQIGMLISAMAIGGMIFQYPLGKLSDLIDRRQVIAGIPLLAIPVIYLLIRLEEPAQHFLTLYILIAILGGLTLPLYSLCMAHMNDYLKPNQMVAASGTLMLVLALGMVFGPALGAVSIQLFGPHGLFYLLLTIAIATVMTAFFRLWGGQPRSVSRNAAVAVCANQTPQAAHLIAEGKNT